MRNRKRLARKELVVAIAVFAVVAAAPAAASASQWEIEGIGGLKAPESITGVRNGSQVLELNAIGLKMTCAKLAVAGTIERAGASKVTLAYTKCALVPSGCRVAEPLVAEAAGQLEGGAVKDKFSEPGRPFTEMTLTGAGCVLAGRYTVEGTQVCSLPGAGAFDRKQELVCAATGSGLKVGGAIPATYSGRAKLELSGKNKGKKWKTR